MPEATYVTLCHEAGIFTIVLFDAEYREVGFGYKGPTQRRAEQDLKYWIRDKKLQELKA